MLGRSTVIIMAMLAFCMISPFAVVHAQTPMELAKKAATELKEAAVALKKAKKSEDRVAALSQTTHAYENGLQAVRESLRAAIIREQVLQLEFAGRREQLSRLLGVLQTMERASTPMLMIHPAGPLGTARSGMVMAEVTPMLQSRAEELRLQLAEMAALRNLQKSAEAKLTEGLAGAQDARVALSAAINERTDLPGNYTDDPVRAQILADNSATLDFFANGLTDVSLGKGPSGRVSFDASKGKIPLPTSGTLLRGFNETDAAGIKRSGIVVTARPLSLVTAPTAATIRFSGAFLDYGKVIILEPEPGFLMVIAGLEQIYCEFGQIVNSGDPIGLLGGKQPKAQDFLIEATEGGSVIGQESLYIEIRKGGKPVNPMNWFALGNI